MGGPHRLAAAPRTGVSSDSRPATTVCASARAVKVLVMEPILNVASAPGAGPPAARNLPMPATRGLTIRPVVDGRHSSDMAAAERIDCPLEELALRCLRAGCHDRPYFLCTACLDTPSTAAISAQDQPAIRARRTTPASRRLAARRSSVAALSAARGS